MTTASKKMTSTWPTAPLMVSAPHGPPWWVKPPSAATRGPAWSADRRGGENGLRPRHGTNDPAVARPGVHLLDTAIQGGNMRQRVPRRAWRSAGPAGHRPRVLIEDDHPAVAISDFYMFEQAGFDVAFCSGPGRDLAACPLLHGRPCPLLMGADVVLHGLDPALGVAAAIARQSPGVPLVVEWHRRADQSLPPVPGGCLPLVFPCSVRGQIDALWRALASPPGEKTTPAAAAHDSLPTHPRRQ
jgi:hypothetical protein